MKIKEESACGARVFPAFFFYARGLDAEQREEIVRTVVDFWDISAKDLPEWDVLVVGDSCLAIPKEASKLGMMTGLVRNENPREE